MGATRIDVGIRRPEPAEIDVDGACVTAFEGETVATALLAAGIRTFRRTASGAPRGPFCNMGACFECLVTIDGEPWQRACRTLVRQGMRVETGADDSR
jgi:predicted molibdopterin-dependent oxidoreductase YjgC